MLPRGAGDEDAALVLDLLAFDVLVGAQELAEGQAGHEHEQHRPEDRVEEQETRVVAFSGFDDGHAGGTRGAGGGGRRNVRTSREPRRGAGARRTGAGNGA